MEKSVPHISFQATVQSEAHDPFSFSVLAGVYSVVVVGRPE